MRLKRVLRSTLKMGSLIIVIELARFWVTPLSPLYGGTVERVIKIVELFFLSVSSNC